MDGVSIQLILHTPYDTDVVSSAGIALIRGGTRATPWARCAVAEVAYGGVASSRETRNDARREILEHHLLRRPVPPFPRPRRWCASEISTFRVGRHSARKGEAKSIRSICRRWAFESSRDGKRGKREKREKNRGGFRKAGYLYVVHIPRKCLLYKLHLWKLI